jgi:hypothetical protein
VVVELLPYPATMILPSGWTSTASGWSDGPTGLRTTYPDEPKVASAVPLALNRRIPKSALDPTVPTVPATTILPSGVTATRPRTNPLVHPLLPHVVS